MKALRISTVGDIEVIDIENKLEVIQDLVGGYIEYVNLSQDGVDMIVNEEGKIYNLDYNLQATLLYRATHLYKDDYICGDVVIVRTKNGENIDLEDADITTIKVLIANELMKGEE
jgi:hypothetical protein